MEVSLCSISIHILYWPFFICMVRYGTVSFVTRSHPLEPSLCQRCVQICRLFPIHLFGSTEGYKIKKSAPFCVRFLHTGRGRGDA